MKGLVSILLISFLTLAQTGLSTETANGDHGQTAASAGVPEGTEGKVSTPPGAFTFLPYLPSFEAIHLLPVPEDPEDGQTSSQPAPKTTGPLSPKEKEKNQPGFAFIDIAKAKDFRDMDILKTAPKEHRADFFLGFRLLPDTEVLLGRGIRLERTPTDSLAPRDDGWRFKIKTNF